MSKADAVFQQFRTAVREQARLPLAVEAYFSGETTPEQTRELESYLKRRIRSLMELLIREDQLPKLEAIADWLNPGLVEDGLDMAIRLKKSEAFVWLLKWKAEHCGFSDRDFTL
ncbi:MAG: hypothetical protein MSS60_05615 [Clostridiales bacterium]|nr:hypothetical protein [Clostridiales bacterium]